MLTWWSVLFLQGVARSAASAMEENTINALLCTRAQEVFIATVGRFKEVFYAPI